MIWINGQLSNGADLILDEGFFFGRGVFETIRVHEQPLFWTVHLARLNQGLALLNIRHPVDAAELLAEVLHLNIRHCVLKIAVSPVNIVMQTRPLPDESAAAGESGGCGCSLTVAEIRRTANPLLLACKSLNYLDNLLAWEMARQAGFDDAIMTGAEGQVCETSRANLFFLQDNQLHTPELACGLLNGVIRQWVMAHYPVRTGRYRMADLLAAEAVFLTSSVSGIKPVRAIDGHGYADSLAVSQIRQHYQEQIALPGEHDFPCQQQFFQLE